MLKNTKNIIEVDNMNIEKFLYNYGYTQEFNLAVTEEVEAFDDMIPESEFKKRKCLFDWQIVTIDGDDSKDFDDAISVKKLKNGKFELGVHIADVSHYVVEGSALDAEAYNRGTSVYLVDNVVPMLPEKLSNNLCSLVPHKPRLTLSCIMKVDGQGNVEDYKIYETAIKSCARLTYHKVTQVLNGNMSTRNEYADFIEMFENMRELALILRDKRMRRGAIDFDFPEPYFELDESGRVVNIRARDLSISNKIIEEFMLLANETVAKHCQKFEIPSVYRVHENPDPEKIQKLVNLVKIFGHKLKAGDNVSPKAMQSLLFRVDGTNAQTVLSTAMLRSMMKAKYSEENLGHFGLAADFYCHFTSPIRRYPDLIVHRILKEWLRGTLDEWRITHYNKVTRRAAEQATLTEIDATNAERDYDNFMCCEYMEDKIGQEFMGIISSVTDFGFFVELPNTIEGLVRMVDLADDYYEFNEDTMLLTGRRTGRVFCMGQQVKVRLTKVNTELKQIDFVLTEFDNREVQKEVKYKGGKQGRKHNKKGHKKKHRSK